MKRTAGVGAIITALGVAAALWLLRGSERAVPPPATPAARPVRPAEDPIATLDHALEQGAAGLIPHEERGYLDAVLGALDVPAASQLLVHSKTSRQRALISPDRPRAIYFNDTTAVAWVPGAEELELLSFSPRLGTVAFYTLSQKPVDTPRLVPGERCFECHTIEGRGGLQGWLMRSVSAASGTPPETVATDDRTPFAARWNGWYVSGPRLPFRHLGRPVPPLPDAYLSRTSDVVALMVLGHQVRVTTLLAALHRRLASGSESTPETPANPEVAAIVDELVGALIFEGEAALPAPIGDSGVFRDVFVRQGVRDATDPSLRDFDLKTRLFRYGVSTLVRSPAFTSLPVQTRQRVLAGIRDRLRGASPSLTRDERDLTLSLLEGLQVQ